MEQYKKNGLVKVGSEVVEELHMLRMLKITQVSSCQYQDGANFLTIIYDNVQEAN